MREGCDERGLQCQGERGLSQGCDERGLSQEERGLCGESGLGQVRG